MVTMKQMKIIVNYMLFSRRLFQPTRYFFFRVSFLSFTKSNLSDININNTNVVIMCTIQNRFSNDIVNPSATSMNPGGVSQLHFASGDILRQWGGDVWSDNNATPGAVACNSDVDCARYPGLSYCNTTSGVCQPHPVASSANQPFVFDGYPQTSPEGNTSNVHENQPQKLLAFDPFSGADGSSSSSSVSNNNLAAPVDGFTSSYRQDNVQRSASTWSYVTVGVIVLILVVLILGGLLWSKRKSWKWLDRLLGNKYYD